jgi:hypothetical protein
MKVILIGIASLVALFFVAQLVFMRSTSKIEGYRYTVIKQYEGFEVRKYEAANFSYVTMNPDTYSSNSGNGFRSLAGYIFGGNEKNEKIAMTSPVAMNFEDSTTMMFMIPSEYEIEDLPKPNNAEVKFKTEPEKIVAAISFGGWANDQKINDYTAQLKALLKAQGIVYTNNFSYLGYNPPYEMVNRRNDIIVEIEEETLKLP